MGEFSPFPLSPEGHPTCSPSSSLAEEGGSDVLAEGQSPEHLIGPR